MRWRKRYTAEGESVQLQASVMIHLGQAWRTHQDGSSLLAIRHLRLAVEAILALIERWSSEKTDD